MQVIMNYLRILALFQFIKVTSLELNVIVNFEYPKMI
jgi:hypothetical protein